MHAASDSNASAIAELTEDGTPAAKKLAKVVCEAVNAANGSEEAAAEKIPAKRWTDFSADEDDYEVASAPLHAAPLHAAPLQRKCKKKKKQPPHGHGCSCCTTNRVLHGLHQAHDDISQRQESVQLVVAKNRVRKWYHDHSSNVETAHLFRLRILQSHRALRWHRNKAYVFMQWHACAVLKDKAAAILQKSSLRLSGPG